MSNGKINLTVVGNVVADPELRFTQSGTAVATFRIASTPKNFDKNTGQWVDGEATFLTCHAWRQLAENIADTLVKGMRVVVTGELQQRNYETRDGQRRTVMELNVDDVGPSLRFSVAQMVQPGREQDRQGFNPQPGGNGDGGWGSPAATGTDAPPF